MFNTATFNALRPCAAAFAAAALLAACGGGSDGDAPPIPPNHIGAEVDGSMVMITKTVEGWWSDTTDPHAFLSADEDADSDSPALTDRGWRIIVGVEPKAGATYECGKSEANILFGDGTRDAADKPFSTTNFSATNSKGACTVIIESVSAGEISGSFTATVVNWDDASDTRKVTNGTFRVPAATGPEPA